MPAATVTGISGRHFARPAGRDAASKSYEYRPNEDVESCVHSEGQD